MEYEFWREMTVSVGSFLALLGFLRGQEQHKDAAFRDLREHLSDPESAVKRATAAAQLPSFFCYRRFFIFNKPYQSQALDFALNGLKVEDEKKFVRQALINALRDMCHMARKGKLLKRDLIDAQLNELIMDGFIFDGMNLTNALLMESDLGRASFVNSNLWKAKLCHANLSTANFTNARIWNADFSHAYLENAIIITPDININNDTKFDHANLTNATLSRKVFDRATKCEGVVLKDVKIVD